MKNFHYYLFGLVSALFLHLIIGSSCFEQNPAKPDDSADVAKINEAAEQIEEIFVNADTTALKTILTDAVVPVYAEFMPQIITVMNDFGIAIQNRTLSITTQNYAEFKFVADSKEYTFALAKQDDGNWKLMRF